MTYGSTKGDIADVAIHLYENELNYGEYRVYYEPDTGTDGGVTLLGTIDLGSSHTLVEDNFMIFASGINGPDIIF